MSDKFYVDQTLEDIKAFSPDVKHLLENAMKCKLEECSIEISDDGIGEGFNGEIKIITLTNKLSNEKKSLAIKQQNFRNPKQKEFTDPLFENEMFFYTSLWPTLQNFYKDVTGINLNFVAKCLGTSEDTNKKILMENIVAEDFKSYPKAKPFDKDHFTKIFETCGILHGISMALKQKDEATFSKLFNNLHRGWKPLFTGDDFLSQSLRHTTRAIQYLFDSDTEQQFINKLKEYEKSGAELVYKSLNIDPPASLFIHGDCWSNNFMFKYDHKGLLEDIKLIDFQFVYAGSPVQDLAYCFYSGGSEDNFDKLDDFLKIYHNSLSETLVRFNLNSENLYSFETLKEEWRNYSKFGFAMALMIWRSLLLDPDTLSSPDLLETDEILIESEQIPEIEERDSDDYKVYRKRIRSMVIHMYNNNFI